MNYQVCDCDPLEYCEHRQKRDRVWINTSKIWQDAQERTAKLLVAQKKALEEQRMATRCNCDASCGENRYHDVGSVGCRFSSEAEYNAYYGITKTVLKEPERKLSDKYTKEEHQPMKHIYDEPVEEPVLESATRPWGIWRVLDIDQGYKVKRLEILPDAAISLQYHNHRSEHWTIVQGSGKVIIDGNIFTVEKGDSFYVPKQALHKVTNTHLRETLIAIEVQMGEICSEDDIVRC